MFIVFCLLYSLNKLFKTAPSVFSTEKGTPAGKSPPPPVEAVETNIRYGCLAYLVYFGVLGILVGVIGVFEIGILCLLHLQFELVHLMFPSLMMCGFMFIFSE